jgi:hypothetical protein
MSSWFEIDAGALDDLRRTLQRDYPMLHARVENGKVVVAGTFAVLGEDAAADRYSVSIALPEDYPRSLPSTWEMAGRIERVIDRHVFPKTGALCVGVPIDLWIRLSGDFSIGTYLEKALRPYLIGNGLVEEGREWPFDESSHGSRGVLEFYGRFLGASDASVVGRFLLDLVRDRVRGHWTCPCGSGKAIRKCHVESVRALRQVPTHMLVASIDHMIAILELPAAPISREPGSAAA